MTPNRPSSELPATSLPVDDGAPSAGAGAAEAPSSLDRVVRGARACVVRVHGDDALAQRLGAAGLWPGAVVERLQTGPLGDPVLFRLHGYRLALRLEEARRVLVRPADRAAPPAEGAA